MQKTTCKPGQGGFTGSQGIAAPLPPGAYVIPTNYIPDAIKANIQQVQKLLTDTQALVDKFITSQQLQVQGLHMERERAEDNANARRQKHERTEEAARALFRALGWEK